MKYSFGRTIVIALGGSVICPETIDVHYLKGLKKFFLKFLRKKARLVLVIGGGRISRIYQNAAAEVLPVNDEDKDWIGIHSTRLNAHLIRTVFKKEADPVVIDSRHRIRKLRYPITIASGWKPGWSTDFIAMQLASDFKVPEAVIAGKPSHVYDKDHQMHVDAKPFEILTWNEYRRLIPSKWKPGLHSPVDPVAARLASQKRIKAIVIQGNDLKNFENLLTGKDFKGTVIE